METALCDGLSSYDLCWPRPRYELLFCAWISFGYATKIHVSYESVDGGSDIRVYFVSTSIARVGSKLRFGRFCVPIPVFCICCGDDPQILDNCSTVFTRLGRFDNRRKLFPGGNEEIVGLTISFAYKLHPLLGGRQLV